MSRAHTVHIFIPTTQFFGIRCKTDAAFFVRNGYYKRNAYRSGRDFFAKMMGAKFIVAPYGEHSMSLNYG